MIEAVGLCKRFPGSAGVMALDSLSISAREGTVLGVLGPNGAGKTTTARILTTLLDADSGSASVAGFDVRTQAHEVRRAIGVAGQSASIDNRLTGRENLTLIGVLRGLGRKGAKARAMEILETFGLADRANDVAKHYSGGMRRRLDLAAALVGHPRVLFLDEPTTGLDPTSRAMLWESVEREVANGVTVLLTTQYLEEADHLADNIAVISAGTVVAEGSPAELKRQVGGEVLRVVPKDPNRTAEMAAIMATVCGREPTNGKQGLTVPLTSSIAQVAHVADRMVADDIEAAEFGIDRPSLDDVFHQLTADPESKGAREAVAAR